MLHSLNRTYPELRNERNTRLGGALGKVKKRGARKKRVGAATKKSSGKSSAKLSGGASKKRAAKRRISESGTSRDGKRKPSRALSSKPSKVKRAGAKKAAAKSVAVSRSQKMIANRVQFRAALLDPIAKCGPGTSVQRLYRIDEVTSEGAKRSHMVFFDRHGWYCEHGRDCPSVAHAKHHDANAKR
jgi:hypothetical protein